MSFICQLYASILIFDEYDGEILNKSESKEHVLNVTRRNSNPQRGTSDNIKNKYEEMLNHAEIITITDNMKTK